ncbi:MAG: tRNA (guanosine(46)-N7)-methyltransferase TrmB [Spirochaetae bacterium HGW-Spirochaetae-9]|nr:MAG: tRNA (guanosine(46)-N7)-methyltransferase TrmB [Spirochaetae bacterium HGW-Spirochaetae-9]
MSKVSFHTASALIRTFVIRAGRLTDAQREAIEVYGSAYILPAVEKNLDLEAIFPDRRPVVMEIGFGMGKATWQISRDRPQYNYLGVEVHSPGVGKLIMELRENAIGNLRIIQHDAVEVLAGMIPEGSLAGLHIFYPDPWPKKRHHKRRLMRQPIIDLMISRLAPGGYLYFVTDIEEYGQSTLELLASCPEIKNEYEGFAPRIEWRHETKFEVKAGKAGRKAYELYYSKKALSFR